jgi:hypothetical protein
MRIIVALSTGLLVVLVLSGAVAIFVFDYFEPAWGRWNSLQIYAWLGALLAAASAAGAWFASRNVQTQRQFTYRSLITPAFLYGLLGTAAAWLSGAVRIGVIGAVIVCAGAAFLFARTLYRRGKNVIAAG